MNPEEVERVVGSITEKDVMDFARRKLWDQDVAVSAVGSIEGMSLPFIELISITNNTLVPRSSRLQPHKK